MSDLAEYLIARHAETLRRRMAKAPSSPADPRPDGVPAFIVNACRTCGGPLRGVDAALPDDEAWHDEFECPKCKNGHYLDVPPDPPRPDERCPDEDEANAATAAILLTFTAPGAANA